MFSENPSPTHSPRRRRVAALAPALTLVLCCALWSLACGHKKSPTPPPSKVPQRVNLAAHQRGSEVVVEFPFPTITISGTPLPGISKIEMWRFAMEVPEFAVEMLAEEAVARQEAQELLDELGLGLYDVITPPEGGVVDPFATGAPPLGTIEAPGIGSPASGGVEAPFGAPALPDPAPTGIPAEAPSTDVELPAETSIEVETPGEETLPEESADPDAETPEGLLEPEGDEAEEERGRAQERGERGRRRRGDRCRE